MTDINEDPKKWLEEELSWNEQKAAERKIAGDIAHKEMFARGGGAHYGLRSGSWIHPHGGERVQLTEPMSDEAWKDWRRMNGGAHPNSKVAICLPFINATDPYLLKGEQGMIEIL